MKIPNPIFRRFLAARYPQYGELHKAALHTLNFSKWGSRLEEVPTESRLHLDDEKGLEIYGQENAVSSSALFSAMASADNLSTIGKLFQEKVLMKDIGIIPFLAICRASVEGSVRAIWTLTPESQDVRLQRAMAIRRSQLLEESWFHKRGIEEHEVASDLHQFATHRIAKIDSSLADLKAKKINGRPKVTFRDQAQEVQQWLDNQQPLPHVYERNKNLSTQMMDLYSIGSAGTHGYSWITSLAPTPKEAISMSFSMLAPAILSLEYAITLIEVHARPQSSSDKWLPETPDYLEPLIELWHPQP